MMVKKKVKKKAAIAPWDKAIEALGKLVHKWYFWVGLAIVVGLMITGQPAST